MSSTIRQALRSLVRTPAFTLLVVGCLGLGIGVNLAFVRVLDALMLRPPAGVRDATALWRVETRREMVEGQRIYYGLQLSRGDVERLAARRETFARVARYVQSSDLSLGSGPEAREVDGAIVDDEYFAVVGARAALGRLIGAADTAPDAPRTVVLGQRLWRAGFGSDSSVIGRRLRVNGEEVTVVGVVGDGFSGVDAGAVDLWLSPSSWDVTGSSSDFIADPESRWFSVLARLAPGTSAERATAVATAVLRGAPAKADAAGGPTEAPRTAALSAISSRYSGQLQTEMPVPGWLLGATAAVLLVACANVGNLLLARSEARRRELAMRVTLGARRQQLVAQLLVESLLLATAGGFVGIAIASIGARAFAFLPEMPALDQPFDARVALAVVATVLLTTLLAGLAPAVSGTRLETSLALRSGARVTTRGSRLRGVLMIGQLAAALALLATAGVFLRSLRALQRVDPGFAFNRVVIVHVPFGRSGIPSAERGLFVSQALARVRALPGVEHAANAFGAPFSRTLTLDEVKVDGVQLPSAMPNGMQFVISAGVDYFKAMGQPILRGRAFTSADPGVGGQQPVIVSESFARAAWKGADPIGRCVRRGADACRPVIGVARDVSYMGLRDAGTLLVYDPVAEGRTGPELTMLARVRAGRDPSAVAREVRAALQAMDARMPYVSAFALPDTPGVRGELAPFQLAATAFSLFGALAVLVASVGLYAVVAYAVTRRTGEIGVRVALGATAQHVRRLVLREGARHVLLGSALGLLLGAAATRALRARLYGVGPVDAPTFVIAALVLVTVALLASWLPARRAAAIPPTEALRSE